MSHQLAQVLVLAACAVVALWYSFPDNRILSLLARLFRAFARHKSTACLSAGLLVLLTRAALLPVWPIPRPVIYDEFSYLLQADTFAHGRLTNPAHPMWPFFESIYILQQPTYASKYPPGQGLAMAAGQVLFGNPWFGVWLSCGSLAAVLCWALQGWLPPAWALLGALIASNLCLFSYWMNSYWGGAVAGIGGALVVGAWVRIVRTRRLHYAWAFGAGAVILLLTRPYEGFLLAAPAALMLFSGAKKNRARIWIPVLTMLAAGFGWQARYDYRVTGHALRMPYQEYFSRYESVPPLTILPVQPTKIFRHFDLEFLDSAWVRKMNAQARSWRVLAIRSADLYRTAWKMYGDPVWLLVLVAGSGAWLRARRSRLLVVLVTTIVAGALIEMVYYPHYAAPYTAVLLILLMQSMRGLRAWSVHHLPGKKQAGRFVVLALFVSVVGSDVAVEAAHIYRHSTPDQIQPVNAQKGEVEKNLLARFPGKHVIFVQYTGTQTPHEEWIYNLADIDHQAVIWAQDRGSLNSKLVDYYPDRSFWVFQPDDDPKTLRAWSR